MKKNILLTSALLGILMAGCSYPHYYYSPNIQNVPLNNESYTFSGLMAGSFGPVNNCFELQTGYSLPGHVALMANYMTGGNNHSTDTYNDFSKLSYFEGALGFYMPFKDIGVFEIYGGYGHGTQHHSFTTTELDGWFTWTHVPDGTADLSFSKIFIQPDIGVKKDWLDVAFSCRFTRLSFKDIYCYNSVNHLDEINTLRLNNTPWLIEPALTCRGGSHSVKGQIQLVFAGRLTDPDLESMFEGTRFTIGIHFTFPKEESEN